MREGVEAIRNSEFGITHPMWRIVAPTNGRPVADAATLHSGHGKPCPYDKFKKSTRAGYHFPIPEVFPAIAHSEFRIPH